MTTIPPTGPPDSSLADAGEAARNRIDQAIPEAATPGSPPPPTPDGTDDDAAFDLFSDGALDNLDFGTVPYRDGKKLENELRRTRDRFKPMAEAFGDMSDDARQLLLDSAPTLGDDLATLTANSARLHPDDRQWFTHAMAVMQDDPVAGAQMLADGAAAIRAQAGIAPPPAPGDQPMPEWAQPESDVVDDAPLTRAELAAYMEQHDTEREFQREVRDNEQAILAQARELGYDPESNDPVEDARFAALIHVAGRPDVGGDLAAAHSKLGEWQQKVIDDFVAGKSADAERPAAPASAGAAPADMRTVETMVDGQQAMLNRLDATLGPDPRRRGPD